MNKEIYDFEKETDKDFLRAASMKLQKEVIELRFEISQLKLQKEENDEIKSKLTGELLVLRRKIFDSKQEKKKKAKDLKKERKKKKKKDLNLLHNKNPNKEDLQDLMDKEIELETQEVEHKLESSKCASCGDDHGLNELKGLFEESTEYDVNYTYYILKRHKRKKYKCGKCHTMVTAPGGTKLKSGGKFSLQIAVKIACDKYQYHLPLERQREMMKRSGVNVSVKTLYSIKEHLYNILYPLNEMNRQDILFGNYVCIDESPMPFYNPKKSSGYAWSMSNNIGAYYQFEPTRSQSVAKEMLSDFKGNVVTDAYESSRFLEDNNDQIHAYCWAHLRRYFFEAMIEDDDAGMMVDYIDSLYEVEHQAKSLEDLRSLRELKSSKIYADIESWMSKNEGHYLKSTLTGKAIKYFYNQKNGLEQFLKDPHIPLDNNAAERRQRCPVMGRKNFQAFRSINGADVGMFFYSIIESCKTNGLDPSAYLLTMGLRSLKSESLESPYQYACRLKKEICKNLTIEFD